MSSLFKDLPSEHPRKLIPSLCQQFYHLGWVTGTGGGISMKLNLSKSQCTPMFMLAYRHRNAGAVIHTHSQHAVMATLLWPGEVFRCTHLEMIKGIYDDDLKRYLRYDEKLVVPIIENTPLEKDLKDTMYAAMMKYPGSSAVLVRRHGLYVWGQTWEKAKTMAECYDYLFALAVEMKKAGLNPEEVPNQ
ncbi:probable methylthioribulose-1-phosphate dehydratase isoform X3 [Stomoxys calcitrans]|uniref:Class II aldolase/adducin N-terminal domain-containing protein n=1 Tax=Stomoxys calcitrans TaxID=35570 RepID=A0A1I8Q1P7_STOCA|nr:probable methylthioribulose-1-phosphate dehydratase isoform X3 [Stomoxys calcitrans]